LELGHAGLLLPATAHSLAQNTRSIAAAATRGALIEITDRCTRSVPPCVAHDVPVCPNHSRDWEVCPTLAAHYSLPLNAPLALLSHRCLTSSAPALGQTASTPSTPPTGTPYSKLIVGAPLETYPNERRVALTPANVALLLKKGFSRVLIESNAGAEAQFLDDAYKAAGATIVDKNALWGESDILLKVRAPLIPAETDAIRKDSTLISFLYPAQNPDLVDRLAGKGVNAFAMDMIPRISRAQVFDALRCVLVLFIKLN
jgi:hypothetical protein